MFVEANPGPVKAALADDGLIAAEIRLPLVWPAASSVDTVRRALRTAGLRAGAGA
jgi:dihydrodipicolinate synthase/N-acetylneuraminate lyase